MSPRYETHPSHMNFPSRELLTVLALVTHIAQMVSPLGPTPARRMPYLGGGFLHCEGGGRLVMGLPPAGPLNRR